MSTRPKEGSIRAPKDAHTSVFRMCGYNLERQETCRCDSIKASFQIILDFLCRPNGILISGFCRIIIRRRQENQSQGEMTVMKEAEIEVTQGHELRNVGGLEKLEQARREILAPSQK